MGPISNQIIVQPRTVRAKAKALAVPYGPPSHGLYENSFGDEDRPQPIRVVREDPGESTTFSHVQVVLELEPFLAMRHVTLRWPSHAGSLRRNVETELARRFVEIRTWNNLAGTWFQWAAAGIFVLAFVFTLLLQILITRAQNL